jgi:hypothetical protein
MIRISPLGVGRTNARELEQVAQARARTPDCRGVFVDLVVAGERAGMRARHRQ